MAVELSKQSSQESHANALAVNKHEVVAVEEMTSVQSHVEPHSITEHTTTTHSVAHSPAYSTHTSQYGSQIAHSTGHHYASHNHHGGRIISTHQGEHRETGETHIIATRTGDRRFTGETRVVETSQVGSHQVSTRVVGVEKGVERQVSVTEVAVGEEIIGEHTVSTGKGRRGRKIIREEVIEKVIVVPETVQIEEWVEDEYDMEETVIEVAKKFQIEKIVEVPEIEIVENIIEQIEKVVREKVVEVPKIQTVERIVEVPVIQTVEKIVEVPEVQYRDIPVEKIVEVPQIQTQEVIREVKKVNFVDKPIEQKKLIVDTVAQKRRLPVPVEAETIVEFTVPHLRANYVKKKFPVYLPRFIEVPVSRQFVDAETAVATEKYAGRLANLISVKPAVSLCEIEGLASEMKVFYDQHNIHNRKTQLGGVVSEQAKREVFSRSDAQLQQYAIYKHLPCEVADLHIGHRHALTESGSCITYSSSTFGTTASSRSYGHTTSHYSSTTQSLPMNSHSTSAAYKVGQAIGHAISH